MMYPINFRRDEKQKRCGREPAAEGPYSLTFWLRGVLTTCVFPLRQPAPLFVGWWGRGRWFDKGGSGDRGCLGHSPILSSMRDTGQICPATSYSLPLGLLSSFGVFPCSSRANLRMTLAWKWHISTIWCGLSTSSVSNLSLRALTYCILNIRLLPVSHSLWQVLPLGFTTYFEFHCPVFFLIFSSKLECS